MAAKTGINTSRRNFLLGAVRRVQGKDSPQEPLAASVESRSVLEEANANFEAESFEQAVDQYRQYLKVHRNDVAVRMRLGRSLYSLGRYTAARLEFKRILKTNEQEQGASLYLGLCLARSARLEDAAEVWDAYFDLKNVPLLRELNVQKGLIRSGEALDHDAVALAVEKILDTEPSG